MRSGRGASPGLATKSSSTRSAPDSGGGGRRRVVAELSRLDLDGQPRLLEPQRPEPRLDRPAELPGGLAARGRERGGRGLQRAERLGQGTVEALQVGLVTLDRGELGLGLGQPRGELVGRAAEPGGQPPVEGQPGLDGLEPRRVVVPVLAEVAQGIRHLAGLVGQPVESRRGVGELGHRRRDRLQVAGHALEDLLGRVVRLVEQLMAQGGGRADGPGVGQDVRVADEPLVLADLGLGGGQLVALELEQGPFPLAGQGRVDQGLAPPPERLVRRAGLAVGLERRLEPPEGIEQLALAVRVEQRPAFVLAVDIDQPLAEPLQAADRHGQAVDLGRAAALGRDPPGDDQLVVLQRPAQDRLELLAERRRSDREDRRGPCLRLARADQLGRGLPPQHQPQRREQEALPRARLPRPGAESLLELDLDVLDQGEVLYRKLA